MTSVYLAAADLLAAAAARPPSPLQLAWRHTFAFWVQTGLTVARHPAVILLCAAVPAVERGYMVLRARKAGRSELAVLDLLVTLWRVGLVAVAVWAASSGVEWRSLSARVGAATAWQLALSALGSYFAHHLRMVLWELAFFALGFWLAAKLLRGVVLLASRPAWWMRERLHQEAAASVLRNLILFPLALIYLVEMARPVFRQ